MQFYGDILIVNTYKLYFSSYALHLGSPLSSYSF